MTGKVKGLDQKSARWLRDKMEPLFPFNPISIAPWSSEDGEWIVTVWDREERNALIDIKDLEPDYLLRQVGTRRVLARITSLADIAPAILRSLGEIEEGADW